MRTSMVEFKGWLNKQGIKYTDHAKAMVDLSDAIRNCTTDIENKIWKLEYQINKLEKSDISYYQNRVKEEIKFMIKHNKKIDLKHCSWMISEIKKISSLPFLKEQLRRIKNEM